MALTSNLVWEVRTTGSDNNGGGFDSSYGGTDYSQQDTAQLSLTDLAATTVTTTWAASTAYNVGDKVIPTTANDRYYECTTAGTSGATEPAWTTGIGDTITDGTVVWTCRSFKLTSATGGFTSAMVGNVIHITAGTNFTAGFYLIEEYVDTNTVGIDRDPTTGLDASAGTGNVGGAVANPSTIEDVVVAGNKVYVKSGTYILSSSLSITTVMDKGLPIEWIGYNLTRDDNPIGDNRPISDGNSVATYCLYFNGGAGGIFLKILYLEMQQVTEYMFLLQMIIEQMFCIIVGQHQMEEMVLILQM